MSAADGVWAEWRREVFGDPYMVWHDGPDFDVLQKHFAEDPARVTAMLGAGLADNDSFAATAMRELKLDDTQRTKFVALLTAARPASSGALQVEIGASLAALTGDES